MLLRVIKVYNNNSALVKVGDHREAVVQGKGIGFRKRPGEYVDSKQATKLLYLGDEQLQGQFAGMLKDVPLDIVVTVFAVIDEVKVKYHLPLLNYIYVTMTDHVFQMYKKLMRGDYQPSLAPDIRIRYPVEYQAAGDALYALNSQLGIMFPNAEVKNLALHFINAEGEETEPSPKTTTVTAVDHVVQAVLAAHAIKRNVNNRNYFDRLMIHLQYLVERVEDNTQDEQTISSDIAADFQGKYPQSYQIANEIATELETKLSISLSENERLYFIIHIQRLIQEQEDA